MEEQKNTWLTTYFSEDAKTCALVGSTEATQCVVEGFLEECQKKKNDRTFYISLPLEQGQTKEELPLEKTWKFWRAVVKRYEEELSIEKLKELLATEETTEREQQEEALETIQEVYEFFARGYDYEAEAERYFQDTKKDMGISEEELKENLAGYLVSRRASETMGWVVYIYQNWRTVKDTEWLTRRLHEKRPFEKIADDIDIVKEIMALTGKETPQACVPVFDAETKFPEEKQRVREFLENVEYDAAEKRLSESEEEFDRMIKEELRYSAVERYQRIANTNLGELRNAYQELGIKIRLIITGFEKAETIYPDNDNIGTLFTELFSLSQKSATAPPDVIMLVSEDVPERYSHHLAVGSNFAEAYPSVKV